MSKQVRISDYLYGEAERLAKADRRSIAGMVELLIEQALHAERQIRPGELGPDDAEYLDELRQRGRERELAKEVEVPPASAGSEKPGRGIPAQSASSLPTDVARPRPGISKTKDDVDINWLMRRGKKK